MTICLSRPALALLVALAPLTASSNQGAAQAAPRRSSAVAEPILEVLEQSLKSGKGVLVYLGQHSVGGAVVKIGDQTVELRSREYGRIVLRLDRIEGVAGN
ncbi:MAG: hypothetical protein HY823_02245 [Acidobacteria bacterium]|nr:hypothetical protein [Acidobacteriota bacterium]